MNRYEYKELAVWHHKKNDKQFNDLGLEGWELVSVSNDKAFFKRVLTVDNNGKQPLNG